jgi:hypothetical protein
LQQRLASVRNRLDQAYLDKLDGKITEELWRRKSGEWQAEEQQIQMAICAIPEIKPERMLDAVKIFVGSENSDPFHSGNSEPSGDSRKS